MPDAAATNPAVYTLVPWVRRGLASKIAAAPTTNFASLPVSLVVSGAAVAAPAVRLLGPGDVTSLDARAVIRTDPRDGADAFEPNYLASVELALPDLPWLFTPSAPAGVRLRPWICLVVIPETDGASITARQDGLLVLRLDSPLNPSTELPDLDHIEAWAHAQVTGDKLAGKTLNAALDGDPSARLSRLIAPRKLEPGRRYNACIVPTFHAGVNAALGLPVDDHDLAPAWDANPSTPLLLPVYYRFRFQTGPGGDFASLAQKIGPPKTLLNAGTRMMDVSQPGFGAGPAPGVKLGLEGALRSVNNQPTPWPAGAQARYEAQLRKVLTPPAPTATATPVVSPPVYGRAQTGTDLPAAGAPPHWLRELNLDPRTRAAASAGAQVVAQDQEALVASAWDQLGEIRKANQLLRQAQLARQVTASIYRRHLETVATDGTYLQVTAPLHSRVRMALGGVSATLRGHMAVSRLPVRVVSPAMRKLARPRGPVGRLLSAAGTPQVVERLNLPASGAARALTAAGPVQAPRGMVALDDVSPAIQIAKMTSRVAASGVGWQVSLPQGTAALAAPPLAAPPLAAVPLAAPPLAAVPLAAARMIDWSVDPDVPDILKTSGPDNPPPLTFPATPAAMAQMQESFRVAASVVGDFINAAPAAIPEPGSLGGSAVLTPARTQLSGSINPEDTIRTRVGARVPLGTGPDPLQPLSTAPRFPQAMYAPLAELSPDWMLPGVSDIPLDTAALLRTNPAFVEAYMVGLNEELSRELVWREFPTALNETYFQNFWGGGVAGANAPDIPAIAAFDPNGHLGDHTADHAAAGRLVLLIRADLFRRYPNAVVSAAPAKWNSDGRTRGLGTDRRWPIFRGEIGSDITFFGFEVDDPVGTDRPADNRPGWYFLVEEHATEPRFGLEPETAPPPGSSWNDLRWSDVTLDRGHLTPASAPTPPTREAVTWGQSAAAMAFILMRRPVRVALHARALIGTGAA